MYRPAPKHGTCSECKQKILEGLHNALPRRWDPQDLSLPGEIQALMLGLSTWWMVGPNAYRRSTFVIERSPLGFGGSIHRDHSCTIPQPAGAAVKPPLPPVSDKAPF